jgi:choline transport protein
VVNPTGKFRRFEGPASERRPYLIVDKAQVKSDPRNPLSRMEASQNSVSTLETTIQDEVDLARIGYTQQLKRRFTIWSMLAFSSCLLGTWEGLSFTLISALQSGGPASLMYGLLLAWVGTLSNAASLAEISSIYPTAGGQYHWAYCLSPPSIRVFASYIVGWIGCSGLVAAGASVAFIAGVQVQGLIILCHPEIEPRAWIVVVVFWGVILFSGLMNVFAVRLLPLFTLGSCTPFPSPR